MNTITRSTLMPISVAASRSSATARMAVPTRVRMTIRVSTTIVSSAAATTTTCTRGTENPANATIPSTAGMEGNALFCAPNMPRAEYSSTNDKPKVLIKGASERPRRNGR